MELTWIAVVGVASIVAVAAFSQRLGLAAPLSLVVVGIGLSFVPGVPNVQVEPEWVLAGVLPPLLYSTAVTMPAQDFRRNFKAISGLSVLLVGATTLGIGVLMHALMPGIGWPAAFALGAVVSPTDAVAATSVGKKLGLPSRLLTVLEGEGLVNDASALVLLRSAIAATAGAVSVWGVAGDFVYSVAVAVVVGILVGMFSVWVRALLRDTVLNTAISFVVPFVAYVPTEELDASGVLAVVVTGLVTGHQSPRRLRAQDRVAQAMNWRTLSFLLESSIFLLMGLGLKAVVDEVDGQGLSVWRALWLGLLASALVIVARMVFVVPLVALLKRDERRAADAKPRVERWRDKLDTGAVQERFDTRQLARIEKRVARVGADIEFKLNEALGWRGGVVLAWSGMRGAITVAAAQTLPTDTPYRPQLILIAFVVAVTTLLLQGLTLPSVIRVVRVPGDDPERLRTEYGELLGELAAAGEVELGKHPEAGAEVRRRVREDSLIRVLDRKDRGGWDGSEGGEGGEGGDGGDGPEQEREEIRAEYVRLRLDVIGAEREVLLGARADGRYSSRALGDAQHMMDLEESRLQLIGEAEG